MNSNTVEENIKRTMAKAMLDEILAKVASGESNMLTREELVSCLEQFLENPPQSERRKAETDVLTGKDRKNQFWSAGDIVCEDNTISLRKPLDCDRNGFLQLQWEHSSQGVLLKNEKYCAEIWNGHNDNTALMVSIIKDGAYIGYCGIIDLSKKPWEIAIELLPQWTHRQIGTTVLPAVLDALQERLGVVDFRVRIDPANLASQGLFEKLGATPNGISSLILSSEEEIKQCEDANLHRIDDGLIAVARKFSVEPRKLLSHALEYKLHWG